MGINAFRKAKSAGKMFGKIINSKTVSTISKDLVKGGDIANKILDSSAVKGLAVSGGPEGLALYGGAKAVASGVTSAGKGIQRAKDATNKTPFKPSYV